MKLILAILLISPVTWGQNLSAEEQRMLLREVQDLKERVRQLENKDSGSGFKTTDYQDKTTEAKSQASTGSAEPAISEEQRKEIMDTIERYKKAQAEQERVLKELEDEE